MTDYLIQEQTTEDELVDESVVLEAFAAMQASYSYLEYMDRLIAINEFCVSTDVECPSVIQEGDFGEAVLSFFENIWDWICGLIRSMMGYFSKVNLSRIIKALKNTSKSFIKEKKNSKFVYTQFGLKMCFTLIDDFCEVLNLISKNKLDDRRDDIIKLLQQIIDGDVPSLKRANSKFVKVSKIPGCPYDLEVPAEWINVDRKSSSDTDYEGIPVDGLIQMIEKVNSLDIPKTGKKLLKKVEYDKDTVKKNGSIDKEVQRLIRRASNNIAKLYDKAFGSFTKGLYDIIVENEIKLGEQDKAFLERTGKSKRTGRDQSHPIGGFTQPLRDIGKDS